MLEQIQFQHMLETGVIEANYTDEEGWQARWNFTKLRQIYPHLVDEIIRNQLQNEWQRALFDEGAVAPKFVGDYEVRFVTTPLGEQFAKLLATKFSENEL